MGKASSLGSMSSKSRTITEAGCIKMTYALEPNVVSWRSVSRVPRMNLGCILQESQTRLLNALNAVKGQV